MIDPLDRAVEFRAVLLGKLGFHVGNRVGEPGPIEVLHRGRNIGEHGEALVGNFRQAAEQAKLGWAIWDWKAGFHYWNEKTHSAEPGMHEALFGRSTSHTMK